MACQRTTEVQRYHDNELSGFERDQFGAHLRDCDECRQLLNELTGLSSLLSRAARAEAPARLLAEIRRSRDSVHDGMIIRLAGWLTAAAAAVLIGALLTWPTTSHELSAPSDHLMAVIEIPAESSSDPVLLAQWMADEFSPASNGDFR